MRRVRILADPMRPVLAAHGDRVIWLMPTPFAPQIDALVEYLPAARQTLLFSATLAGFRGAPSTSALSGRLGRLRSLVDAKTVEFVSARDGAGRCDIGQLQRLLSRSVSTHFG